MSKEQEKSQLIENVQTYLRKCTPQERVQLIYNLTVGICIHCGELITGQCTCLRDE